MKIASAKINSFIQSPDPNIRFILIYGPDLGLIAEQALRLYKTVLEEINDPFRVAELTYPQIKDDPTILHDEINAISMTGGRRLIKIQTDSTSITKDLTTIIDQYNGDSLIVFTANDLTPSSSLRKYFESAKNAAAIPCYKDDNTSIKQIINQKLQQNNIHSNHDTIQYLSEQFAGNRLVILNEIDKLITYLGENKNLNLETAKACIFDSSEPSLDDLCNAIASRNTFSIERSLNKALQENINAVTISRSILRYFMRLKEVKEKITSGIPEQQAISSLRPPVFFKQMPLFKQHLSSWKNQHLSKIIKKLIDLEVECKRTNISTELLCSRTLLMLPISIKR